MKDIVIYVVTHKPFICPRKEGYKPIQVGKSYTNIDLGILSDDSGDNIAIKNPNYCELTALYWIWKNDTSDIVGLCHYRRYFSKARLLKSEYFFLSKSDIEKCLSHYDMIVPNKETLPVPVGEYYVKCDGRKQDLDNLDAIVKEYYPEYYTSFKRVLKKNQAFYCNMMVCKRDVLKAYCAWLFELIEKLEKITCLDGYSKAEKRIYGYLSEILLNVWVDKNGLAVKHINVINTEASILYRAKKMLGFI